MALTKYIKHYQGWDVNGTQSVTTTSFTPENNSLLVALVLVQSDNGGTGLIYSQTVSGGGLTWNLIDEYDISYSYSVKAFAYYAEVGSASSMTFTFDSNDSNGMIGPSIIIYNFTGYDTSTPIGGYYVTGGSSRSGAYNGTLSATPALSSYIVAGTIIDEGTLTAGTGWTNDQSDTTYSYLLEQFQSRTNWASPTVAWNAITTAYTWASAAVEVRAAFGIANTFSAGGDIYTLNNNITTSSLTVESGDIIVVFAACENDGQFSGDDIEFSDTQTNTYTELEVETGLGGDGVYARLCTAVAGSSGTLTVTGNPDPAGTDAWSMVVMVWRGSAGVGAHTQDEDYGGWAPTVDLTTTGDNSAVCGYTADWGAVSGTYTWDSTDGTPVKVYDYADDLKYGVHAAYYLDIGSQGTKTIGMTSPSSQEGPIFALEILGPEGASGGGAYSFGIIY